MNFCLVSSNKIVEERLLQHSGPEVEWALLTPELRDFSSFDLVLIFEPYYSNGTYVSIYRIWKRYLARKAPATKLAVAGFEPVDHPNYLNLLEVDRKFDWSSFAHRALSNSWEWEAELHFQTGLDISKKINLFFQGHNNEGIVDTTTRLRGSLDNASIRLNGSQKLKIDQMDFRLIWSDILYPKRASSRVLFSRWFNYSQYFDCLPFCHELRTIKANDFIQKTQQFLFR